MILSYEAIKDRSALATIYAYKAVFESANDLFMYHHGTTDYDTSNGYRRYCLGAVVDGVCKQVTLAKPYDTVCTYYFTQSTNRNTGSVTSTKEYESGEANFSLTIQFDVYSEDDYTCSGYVFENLEAAQAFYDSGDTSGVTKYPPKKTFDTMPDAIKELYMTDNIPKNLRIHFPKGEFADLVNKDIIEESLTFTESICSQSKLKLGLCEASVLEFEYAGTIDITGCEIAAYHEIDVSSLSDAEIAEYGTEADDVPFPFFSWPYGVFKVDECQKESGKDRWKVTAYTQRFDAISDLNPVEIAKQEAVVTEQVPYKMDALTYICANIKNIYEAQPDLFTDVFEYDAYDFEERTYMIGYKDTAWEDYYVTQAVCACEVLEYEDGNMGLENYLIKFNYSHVDDFADIRADIMKTTGIEDASKLEPFFKIATGDIISRISGSSGMFNTDFLFSPHMTGVGDGESIVVALPLKIQYVHKSKASHDETIIAEWDVCKKYSAFACRPIDTYYTQTLSFDREETEDGYYCCEPDRIKCDSIATAWMELNGLFCKASRKGGIEFFNMSDYIGLYPSDDLCPSDDLYPDMPNGGVIFKEHYISVLHDNEQTKPYKRIDIPYKVEKLVKKETQSTTGETITEYELEIVDKCATAWIGGGLDIDTDDGLDIGHAVAFGIENDPNKYLTYSLSGNYLLQNFCIEDEQTQLSEIAKRVEAGLKDIQYMPEDAELIGRPWVEAGDAVAFDEDSSSIPTIVLRRTLSGIHSLRDAYESQ